MDSSPPLLSIITINYNHKNGLKKTFDSIFNQTWQDFEYIVIDGGSKDGSKELIEANKDRIDYWVSEPDNGVYNAMNNGIRVANGDYVLFLNGGDFLYNDEVLCSVFDSISDTSVPIYSCKLLRKSNVLEEVIEPNEKLNFLFFSRGGSLPHPSTFIKKSLFEKYFYYNEDLKIVSDWEFFFYVIGFGNEKVEYLNTILSVFMMDGISTNPKNIKLKEDEIKSVLKNRFSFFSSGLEKYIKLGYDLYNNQLVLINRRKNSSILRKIQSFLLLIASKLQDVKSKKANFFS